MPRTPLVRVRKPNEKRYTSVRKISVLSRGISRSLAAGKRMQDRAFKELLLGRSTLGEYEENRQAIEKKLFESIERKNKQIIRVGERDPKFGMLFNDVAFRKRAENFLRDNHGCVIMLDVDHFKKINDTLGHDKGDVALRFLADYTNQTARALGGFAGRLGGEEYGVLIPGGKLIALRFVFDLRRVMVGEFAHNETLRTLLNGKLFRFSVGISERGEQRDFEKLLKLADHRLYISKRAGRNRVAYDENRIREIR